MSREFLTIWPFPIEEGSLDFKTSVLYLFLAPLFVILSIFDQQRPCHDLHIIVSPFAFSCTNWY